MNTKALTMKKEIHSIAKHRALLISKYYLALVLIVTTLYLGLINYALSPFYVFIVLYGIPPIFRSIIKDNSERYPDGFLKKLTTDSSFLLNSLKKKYKYSKTNYLANSVSYLIALLMIGLWQFNYNTMVRIHPFLQLLPSLILSTALILRYLGIIFYQIKFSLDLSHNRV